MRRAAVALRGAGARQVLAFAAHGLFVGSASEVLRDESIGQLIITDSVPPFRLPAVHDVRKKLRVVSAAPLFAQAIRASHAAWRR
jgi:ribose-phosphate pyrophosphokinase